MALEREKVFLNFNKIYYIPNLSENISNEIFDYLFSKYSYKKRSTDKEGEYEISGFNGNFINLSKEIINEETHDDDSEVIEIEYKDYNETIEKINSDFKITTYTHLSEEGIPSYIDIIVMQELKIVCVVGPEDYSDKPYHYIKMFFEEKKIHPKELIIDKDFPLWLIWKGNTKQILNPGIRIKNFTDMAVAGSIKDTALQIPQETRTKEKKKTMISLPILYGLFNNQNIKILKGYFNINKNNKNSIYLKIIFKEEKDKFKGSIYFYAIGSLSSNKIYIERLKICSSFIYLFGKVIENWENSNVCEKFVPIEYLDELDKHMDDQITSTKQGFEKIKNSHMEKRENC
ncbi:hypothetical protein [Methanobrevibacter sp. DSM 116169]|uniref:hypothetical protein n=1 Tax=Methanobrevibacter sp. DSM 116169 TaxID=3242727 RepID=UPI0038FC611D